MKIRPRLLLMFMLVGVLPLLLFSVYNLRQDEVALRAEVLGRLDGLADKKLLQVQDYLHERLQNVRFQARSPRVTSALAAMPALYAQNPSGSGYQAQDALTRDYFRRYIEESGLFYDAFLISAQGDVVYTQKHESDFATNLNDGPLRDTNLAQAFRNARMTLEPVVSDYAMYEPSHEPALFVAAPVMLEGKFAGVLAFQLGNALLYRVAQDQTGLGVSGEAVFAKRDVNGVLYATPLRYQPDAALKFRVDAGGERLPAMFHAINGSSGSGFRLDYRGEPVAAAWRYLPELDWGMVVEIDEAEVIAPIREQRTAMLAMLAVLLLLSGAAAWLFGRQIARPLKRLAQEAGEVANGNLERHADESAPGEVGEFAHSFNQMAASLREMYRMLEARIEERTRDLNEAKAKLEGEIAVRIQSELELENRNNELLLYKRFMDSSSNAMVMTDLEGRLIYGNRALCAMLGIAADELSLRYMDEFCVPEKRRFLKEQIWPQLAGQGTWRGECGMVEAHGKICETMSEWFAVLDSQGHPYAYASVIEDISLRKKAEAMLKRHQWVLETAQDGFWEVDSEGRLSDVNDAYARMTGYSKEELLGMRISDLEANEDPDKVRGHMEKIIATGHDLFETRHRCKDGRLIDIEVATTFDRNAGRFFVFTRDITERQHSQLELLHQRELLDEAQRLGQLGSWELDLVNGKLYWSDEIYRIFELDPAEFQPSYENFLGVIHPDDRDAVNRAYSKSLEDRQPYDIVHRLMLRDGRIKWVREHCTSEFDETGRALRSVGAVQDITEQRLAEDQLRIAAAAFETHEAIMITDADANIIRVNRAFEETTGYSAEEVKGKNPRILSSGRQDKEFYAEMWRQLKEKGEWTGEMWDRRKSGEVYPKWLTITAVRNAEGATTEYVAIFSDITERKRAEEEIRHLAFYDALTKLPNRRLLMDRLHQAVTLSARNGTHGAVMFLDMDRFKVLNDTLGHDYGDLMLIEVAERIEACVREVDTVARLGGDEFVVLLEEVGHDPVEVSRRAAHVAEKIRASLARPYLLKDTLHHSSPSIGVSLYGGDGDSVDTLLKQADMAMYQAKEAGRNAVRFFDPDMQQALEGRAKLEADLRNAVPNGELLLHYQIQVDRDFRPVGAEALVRWQHPQRGLVPPGQFIPVAEESSLIVAIGDWVLEEGCRRLAVWRNYRATHALTLAVNVSAAQFRQPDFVDHVSRLLLKHNVDPSRLKLELTESLVMADISGMIVKMQALKALGVKLSMDDFGTGYSSLSYLKNLPLDQLKIDQSFVRDLEIDRSDAVMVRTILDMAHNFELEVVAEGVETEMQRQFLKQHGCKFYQGYLFSKPVPVEEFEKMLGGLQ